MTLQVDPDLCGYTEVSAEAQCRVGGDSTLAVHNFVDASWRHLNTHRKAVLSDSERLDEFLLSTSPGRTGS